VTGPDDAVARGAVFESPGCESVSSALCATTSRRVKCRSARNDEPDPRTAGLPLRP
jgi:hypothetical protein